MTEKMKTTIAILSVMVLAAGFTGCKNKKTTVETITTTQVADTHNSRNSLDYQGTYEGVLPCADCEGIKTEVVLKKDTYTLSREYLGKKSEPFKSEGSYKWDSTGSIITLENETVPNKYKVGENVLIHLDSAGNQITGDLAENYKLKKK